MSSKPMSKTRSKKALDTTLGRAPSHYGDDPIDLSHVRKPIETSIFGLAQVLKLFETSTDEVRRYVAYECDLIYECRMCRTIFRSLANFILHKRSYCTDSYRFSNNSTSRYRTRQTVTQDTNIFDCDNFNLYSPEKVDSNDNVESSNETTGNNLQSETRRKKDLRTVLNRLYDKQESSVITEQCLSEEVSSESQNSEKESVKNNVALQKLSSSNVGVYQTVFPPLRKNGKLDFMKTEVMEIHDILEDNEAILGTDGKVILAETEKKSALKNNYTCNVCNQRFSTKRTLIYHIRYKHNNSTLIYPCTECKETFANAWCVFRHLYKVHQKSTTQVRKLRNLIHDSAIKRSEADERRCNVVLRSSSYSEVSEKCNKLNDKWMDSLECEDFQRCLGCGRKFERRAALHSHTQFCAKRIALCNSTKEINKKLQAEEKLEKPSKEFKTDAADVERVRRRKPLLSHKIYRADDWVEETGSAPNDNNLKDTIDLLDNKNDLDLTQNNFLEDVCQVNDEQESDDIPLCNKPDIQDVDSVVITETNENTGLNLDSKFEIPIQSEVVESNEMTTDVKNEKMEYESTSHITLNSYHNSDFRSSSYELSKELKRKSNCMKKLKLSLAKRSQKYINMDNQSCLPCKKHFQNYRSLMKHMALHFNWYRYHCTVCKYLSYTKSKCKHHVKSKHNISDKNNLSSTVRRISCSKIHKAATHFTKHYKKKKGEVAKACDETVYRSCTDNLDITKTDVSNDATACENIQDPLVRQMVMEVIFGTPSTTSEEELVRNHSNNIECLSDDLDMKDEYEAEVKDSASIDLDVKQESNVKDSASIDLEVKQDDDLLKDTQDIDLEAELHVSEDIDLNSSTSNEEMDQEFSEPAEDEPIALKLKKPVTQRNSRPIRTRITPVHKDFLYDMKNILNLNCTKGKKLQAKVKLRSAHCKSKKGSLRSGVIYLDRNSIKCVQPVETSIVVKHVTGDT